MAFGLLFGFSFLMTPIIYNDFIIGLIEYSGQGKLDRLRSIDMYICLVFIIISLGFIYFGITGLVPNLVVIGFFIGLFFIISMGIIQAKKISGSWFKDIFQTIRRCKL